MSLIYRERISWEDYAASVSYTHLDVYKRQVAGEKVIEKRDYKQRKCWDLVNGKEQPLELPCSEVLYYLSLIHI